MKALGNKIIVLKKKDTEKVTSSGLLVYDNNTHGKINEAEIISIGPKCNTSLKAGNIVLLVNGAGVNFTEDGVEYHLIVEDDIDLIKE